MGLAAGILWIIVGIVYIAYKFGEEEAGGGKAGGIGCAAMIVVPILLIWAASSACGEEGAEAIAGVFAFLLCIVLPAVAIISGKRSDNLEKEKMEIYGIRDSLPTPTESQMAAFIEYIKNAEDEYESFYEPPSELQRDYCKKLNEAGTNTTVGSLNKNDFRYMQAAWIYYSEKDTHSRERIRIFGEQDLSTKTFFDPTIDRSGEPKAELLSDTFYRLIGELPVKISGAWCEQSTFAREIRRMIDEGVQFTEESLYPIMVGSCAQTYDWSKSRWMKDEVSALWCAILPKAIYALSEVSMSRKQEDEWLKVEAYRIAILPAIQEKRMISNAEAFEILTGIYDMLVKTEFSNPHAKLDFELLWHGLDGVGKAVGNHASFFDFPEYIV